MTHKIIFLLYFLSLSSVCLLAGNSKIISIYSPDKHTRAEFTADGKTRLHYRVFSDNREVIEWSDAGLETNRGVIGSNAVIVSQKHRIVDEKFAWRLGESDTIVNQYNELVLNCMSNRLPFQLIIRAYNGSIAFRYDLSSAGVQTIKRELTTFHFSQSSIVYQYNHESVFTPTAIDTLKKTCDLPATIHSGSYYLTVGEAENESYTKAEFIKGALPNTLAVAFMHDTAVIVADHFQTPWRTISLSKTAVGLHNFSDLYLRLNTTTVKDIPNWIEPGKLIRAQLSTQSGLECIDFAVKHHFQYIMYDGGWYGLGKLSPNLNPTRSIPAIDLQKVISYGNEKGVKVILYVDNGLTAYMDSLLPLYKKWGVAGFKFGFVDGRSQKGITWLNQMIRKVNDYGFILNIHDNYKPTGLSRKYPALLTQEGIRGDENSPDAFHTTTLPFTRFLAGPADFTFCFPNSKNSFSKNIKVSKAQQMALMVVYFSPLQAVFWYGKPLDYTNDEEIEFFDYVPTVWNESHYLAGEIGKNISVARRDGSTWFVGNVAGFEDWIGSVRFDFLSAGQRYEATVYEDDGAGNIRKRIEILKKDDVFPFDIKAKGGQAMIIRKK
ncbi:MAG TPA: glycoside hydrolase family 97 catalytic domain-containing protein [Bacteroidales bacterium]|nr:glycoside hydrolase family 97 catalytic domain-containing protein [Bacteroidales bacterium]